MKELKTGYVAIVGKPNVGKSTLINTIMKRKVSIISYKPQTTRNQIKALYNDDSSSIMFIDTPGYHPSRNKLDERMNNEIKGSYKLADCTLLLIDLTRQIDDEDRGIIKIIRDFHADHVILVLTKSDIAKKNIENKYVDEIKRMINIDDVLTISSLKVFNITLLLEIIKKYLNKTRQPLQENEDDDNFVISELIREQIIFNTKKEVPYSTYVYVESKKFENNIFEINAVIAVEKESQKPIMLGKGGQMIKKIGTMARKELLNIYDCRINLKLFVKVEKN
jgi:GTP-binding protein Era